MIVVEGMVDDGLRLSHVGGRRGRVNKGGERTRSGGSVTATRLCPNCRIF
jgi:hypothetical protein